MGEEKEDTKESDNKMDRRDFLKLAGAGVAGAAVGAAIEYPIMSQRVQEREQQINQLQEDNSQLQEDNNQLQEQLENLRREEGYLTLNPIEIEQVGAIAETIIPSEGDGPGAIEAGVVLFIDGRLADQYGRSGNMYMQGPFVKPDLSGPITVDGITYSEGTMNPTLVSGLRYQYPLLMRELWRVGLENLNAYTNEAYGDDFQELGAQQRSQVLMDLWNNEPENFEAFTPKEFFHEVYNLVVAGYFADPLYGSNKDLASWEFIAFRGVAMPENYTLVETATTTEMIRISPPRSLKDIQRGGKH